MAFIDEQQGVVGEVFEQGRGRLPRQAASQEAAVILDPRATAGGGDHLQVEIGALFEPLGFEQFGLGVELLQPFGEFVANGVAGLFERRSRRHIMAVGVDLDRVERGDLLAGQRIEFGNRLNLVAEEADTPGAVFIMRREQLERVAPHPEIAARKARLIAFYTGARRAFLTTSFMSADAPFFRLNVIAE